MASSTCCTLQRITATSWNKPNSLSSSDWIYWGRKIYSFPLMMEETSLSFIPNKTELWMHMNSTLSSDLQLLQSKTEIRHSWNTYLRQRIDSFWHKAFELSLLVKLQNVHLQIAGKNKFKFYKRNYFSSLSTEEFGTHILRTRIW